MKLSAFLARVVLLAACAAPAAGQPAEAPARGGGAGAAGAQASSLPGRMLALGDQNADRKLTRDEFTALAGTWFDALDPDRTGQVSQEEFIPRFGALTAPPAGGGRGGRGGAGGGIAATDNSLGVFLAADRNLDRTLQRPEWQQAFEEWFKAWDANRSDGLEPDEISAGLNAVLPKTNLSGVAGRTSQDPIPGLPTPPPSPILPAAESMKTVQLVDGFRLELAASEPMIEDPVALSFDEDGRAYVVEMRGYMLDIDRTGERDPISRISRLEDTDGDGRFDKSTVFVDDLILPRAVAAMKGGIFYVSDYQLFFARDTDGDGKADHQELVDADYGRGNVEHAPNALFRAMDNWIYNGESPWRYRLIGDTLVKQETEQRGQWGMTQDNYGRLLYNVNNSQLLGDFAPGNYLGRNPHHPSTAGLNLFVATDQRVWPIRMTTAINRGYSPEVINSEGKVWVFASSCSPVVYRGDNFPAEFVGNAFVADPAVHLLKRNLLSDANLTLSSKFAYEGREFLASTDERFRPVNLYNGPDGTLWFLDIYHGVAQYSQFMTAYLRKETLARGLDKGIHHGRIYRVVSTAKQPKAFPRLSRETPAALVARLADANGWIRDTAQRLLVERGDVSVAPALAKLVESAPSLFARVHALWTLEGLFAAVPPPAGNSAIKLLKAEASFAPGGASVTDNVFGAILKAVGDADAKIQSAAISVAESLATGNAARQQLVLQQLERIAPAAAPDALFQAALSAGNLPKPDALPVLVRIATRASEHLLVREAVMSGLRNWELTFAQLLLSDPQWAKPRAGGSALLQALASAVIREREPTKIEALRALVAAQQSEMAWRQRAMQAGIAAIPPQTAARPAEARALTNDESSLVAMGTTLYQQLCAGCHGLNGQGMTPLAPPLANSDWVTGVESRLIRLVLHGVSGPIRVNGTTYQPPNILPEMPGLASLDDAQLAAVLSYVRRAWGHTAAPVTPVAVGAMRSATREQARPWTEAQLLEVK